VAVGPLRKLPDMLTITLILWLIGLIAFLAPRSA
jgi:hypothetical protein